MFEFLFGNPEFAQAFFGAFLSALGTLGSMFGGQPDNSANIAASVQNQKLQSATDRANKSAEIAQRAGEAEVGAQRTKNDLQQEALNQIVGGFRNSLLRKLR